MSSTSPELPVLSPTQSNPSGDGHSRSWASIFLSTSNPTSSSFELPDSTPISEPQPKKKKKEHRGKGGRGRYGCRTCRERHLKCDETHPICAHCTKAHRECVWTREIRLNHDLRSSSYNTSRPRTLSTSTILTTSPVDGRPISRYGHGQSCWPGDASRRPNADVVFSSVERSEASDYVANLLPTQGLAPPDLLQNSLEASLFRYYIDHAGPWLDITSPARHFSLTVPRLALSNPVLLYACLSYSSKALLSTSSLSEQYSSACIKLLIPLLSDELFVSTDETLLATLVILRHVEQYAEVPEDRGAHLTGAFSLIASQKVLPPHDSLPGTALWTYMRQDVRQALLNRSSPKLTPSHGIQVDHFSQSGTVGESVWADRACHLAALACTFAWGNQEGEVDGDELDTLLNVWSESLPSEYLPFHVSDNSIQFLARWHGKSSRSALIGRPVTRNFERLD